MRVIKDSFSGQVDVSNIGIVPVASMSTRMQSAFDPRVSHDARRQLADTFQVSREAELRIREKG